MKLRTKAGAEAQAEKLLTQRAKASAEELQAEPIPTEGNEGNEDNQEDSK
jgi:hypothetical protein